LSKIFAFPPHALIQEDMQATHQISPSYKTPSGKYVLLVSSNKYLRCSHGRIEIRPSRAIDASVSIASTASTPSISTRRDSEIFSPIHESTTSDTELGSDDLESDDELSDSDSSTEHRSEILQLLESQLLAVIQHDRNLAAILIPEIHELVYPGGGASGSYSAAASHSTNDNDQIQGSSNTSPSTNNPVLTDTGSSNCSNAKKRGINPDESDDNNESEDHKYKRRTKRPKSGDNLRAFACVFHKHDPEKYNPWTSPEYLKCLYPLLPGNELRRIK
jgi:hypothetical protein